MKWIKVQIIINPPYNKKDTKDWKYNCDYVDGNDQYKHSKWLTFMERRLKLAKQLLNPKDSVLIVTIDEVEYARLGLLLEQIFPEARIQMVSSVNSPQGNQRKMQFSRIDEYIYFVEIGESAVVKLPLEDEWRINADDKRTTHLHWQQLIRNGADGTRRYSPKSFYPIYVSKDGKKFLGVGDPPPLDVSRDSVDIPDGVVAIWPMQVTSTLRKETPQAEPNPINFFKMIAFSSIMVYNVYNYSTYEVDNYDRYATQENDHTRYSGYPEKAHRRRPQAFTASDTKLDGI